MYRFFFIAKNNMKKQKKDMITFFIMTFISAVLIYLSITMLIGSDRVLNDLDKKINAADVFVFFHGSFYAGDRERKRVVLAGSDQADRV